MGNICKKCGYARKETDKAPDYECPKCGAVYAKVEARLKREAEDLARQGAKEQKDRQDAEARRIDEEKNRARMIGPPQAVSGAKSKGARRRIILTIILFLLGITLSAAISIFVMENLAKQRTEEQARKAVIVAKEEAEKAKSKNSVSEVSYALKLNSCISKILDGAALSENITDNVIAVWRDAIKSGYIDFNEELRKLYAGNPRNAYRRYKITDDVASLNAINRELDTYALDLRNPPPKFRDAYNTFMSLYTIHREYSSQALSPSGSLKTFSADVNAKKTSLLALYHRLRIEIP